MKTKQTQNPNLYRQLSVPFESEQKAQDAFDAFAEDLRVIREKHKIADVVCIVQMSCMNGDDEGIVSASMSFGDPLKKTTMLAVALGSEQEKMTRAIGALLKGS